jgi:hypothetical protein
MNSTHVLQILNKFAAVFLFFNFFQLFRGPSMYALLLYVGLFYLLERPFPIFITHGPFHLGLRVN